MMMEGSFDTEESFDDPSCLAPQPPGSVSPAKRQIKEVKETKITVSSRSSNLTLLLLFFFFFFYFFCLPSSPSSECFLMPLMWGTVSSRLFSLVIC